MSDLSQLVAREAIRDLVLRYCRGVDRGDLALVRSLYAPDAFEEHGDRFVGPAEAYVDWLAEVLPSVERMTHHVGNHLIAVDGDTAEGEVGVTAWHRIPGEKRGHWNIKGLRYLDHYRCDAGAWRFTRRHIVTDWTKIEPVGPDDPALPQREIDPSYVELQHPLFRPENDTARGS